MEKSLVWDCGSSLYDSFELNSFQRQLDSAIAASRTLSMPHLSHSEHDHPRPLQLLPPPNKDIKRSSSSKISRSVQKLIRWVFRSKPAAGSLFRLEKGRVQEDDGFYAFYDGSCSGGLSTIREVPEMAFHSSPRRTASERFPLSSCSPLGLSFGSSPTFVLAASSMR